MSTISWTLIHSLWLGILAAILAGFIIMTSRRRPAIVRYWLLLADLLLFVLATIAVFCYEVGQEKTGPATRMNAATRGNDATKVNEWHPAVAPVIGQPGQPMAPSNTIPGAVESFLDKNASLIVDIWLACLFVQLVRLTGGLYGLRRIRLSGKAPEDGTVPEGPPWIEMVETLAGRLGIKRSVRLLESALVKVPSAAGFFRPVILVPLGMLINLPADQIRTILLHELAHIKRGDYLMNLLLHITGAIFFFNPGILWLNSLIRREREACCDDMVLTLTADRSVYLEALVAFKEYFSRSPESSYAVALGDGQLLWRVLRILSQENKTLNNMEKTILSFGLAAIIAGGLISMKPVGAVVLHAPAVMPQIAATTPQTAAATSQTAAATLPAKPLVTARILTAPVAQPAAIDTIPDNGQRRDNGRRWDSLKIRKAELDRQKMNSPEFLEMRKKSEEMALRYKSLADSLDQLKRDQYALIAGQNALSADNITLMVDQYTLAADQNALSADAEKLAKDRLTLRSDIRIQQIIEDLEKDELITSDNPLSFSLDKDRLLVNGKPASPEVFLKYKKKYLRSPKDHFNYMHHDGSTATDIWVDND